VKEEVSKRKQKFFSGGTREPARKRARMIKREVRDERAQWAEKARRRQRVREREKHASATKRGP
jgi:type IV secretory pathway TrbL component